MALSRPEDACYCSCCCTRGEPGESDDRELDAPAAYGTPYLYNRRYDCNDGPRWANLDLAFVDFSAALRAMRTRLRDLGRDPGVVDVALDLLIEADVVDGARVSRA